MGVDLWRYGIPEDFAMRTWESLFELDELNDDERKLYNKIYVIGRRWIKAVLNKKTHLGLFLTGANGSGKSTFGCLILKDLLEQGYPARRATMAKLQKDFYDNWTVPPNSLKRGALLIEEVGKEYKTKNEHSEYVLEYILKYRSERKYPTILIANADINDLVKRYGGTVESVVKGTYFPINFPSIDLRQRTARKSYGVLLGENN